MVRPRPHSGLCATATGVVPIASACAPRVTSHRRGGVRKRARARSRALTKPTQAPPPRARVPGVGGSSDGSAGVQSPEIDDAKRVRRHTFQERARSGEGSARSGSDTMPSPRRTVRREQVGGAPLGAHESPQMRPTPPASARMHQCLGERRGLCGARRFSPRQAVEKRLSSGSSAPQRPRWSRGSSRPGTAPQDGRPLRTRGCRLQTAPRPRLRERTGPRAPSRP